MSYSVQSVLKFINVCASETKCVRSAPYLHVSNLSVCPIFNESLFPDD